MKSLRFLLALCAPLLGTEVGRAQDKKSAEPNFLVNVSARLVSAAAAQAIDETEPIHESVLETEITGTARIKGRTRAELVADRDRAVLDLIAEGETRTGCVGAQFPVFLYTAGLAPFTVRKRILVDAQGIHAWPARAKAWSHTQLLCVTNWRGETGVLSTMAARRLFYANLPAAEDAIGWRMERRLAERFEAEATPSLESLGKSVNNGVDLIAGWGMKIEQLRFGTSPQEVRISGRVVNSHLLGKIPLPPDVPEPFDLAGRIHESLLNEAFRISFAGKTKTVDEIEGLAEKLLGTLLHDTPQQAKLRTEFKKLGKFLRDLGIEPVTITFADTAPLTIAYDGKGFTLVLRGTRYRAAGQAYPAMNVIARYDWTDNIAARRRSVDYMPPRLAKEKGDIEGKLTPDERALRRLLSARLAGLLTQRLELNDLTLRAPLNRAGSLTRVRADSRDGWLILTWKR